MPAKYSLPTNVNTGTTGHAGLHNSTNGAINELSSRVITGDGSPVGVVTPDAIGQLFATTTQSAAAGGALWYSNGVSPASWIPAIGDTGWRDVSGLSPFSGWTSVGSARIRRINGTVELVITNAVRGAGATQFTIPQGFTPQGLRRRFPVLVDNDTATMATVTTVAIDNPIAYLTFPTSGAFSLNAIWATATAWPTTLPGVGV